MATALKALLPCSEPEADLHSGWSMRVIYRAAVRKRAQEDASREWVSGRAARSRLIVLDQQGFEMVVRRWVLEAKY